MNNVIWSKLIAREDLTSFEVQILRPPCAKVTLVSYMQDPEQVVARVCDTYSGVLDNYWRDDQQILSAVDDMRKTKLKTPLEMLHFIWLFNGVSRAFTHQLVRYRVGTSFAQESMRFFGQKDQYNVLATGKCTEKWLHDYGKNVASSISLYEDMIQNSVPSEDARGILPTNILTSIFFDCNLLTFQNIFNQRVCCQAQAGEWIPILIQMRKIIEEQIPELKDLITAPVERGESCGYGAKFDRPCTWKNGIPK